MMMMSSLKCVASLEGLGILNSPNHQRLVKTKIKELKKIIEKRDSTTENYHFLKPCSLNEAPM